MIFFFKVACSYAQAHMTDTFWSLVITLLSESPSSEKRASRTFG